MKLQEILEQYDTHLLDQIAADKVDETITLRLPPPVIIQEIITALSSQSYIFNKILYGKPPTYAILNLVLQAPESRIEIDGFSKKVVDCVTELKSEASTCRYAPGKNRSLYAKIMKRAWENDNLIDKSEAHILELVKQELGIWDREHYILMHDESIIGLWDMEQEYYQARNQLLTSGILLALEGKYIIADEVALQIRKAFGIELMDSTFHRMLENFSREDLVQALERFGLNISGVKSVLAERLIKSLIPATEILASLHLETLRDLCRKKNIPMSGSKSQVISNILEHFDQDRDLFEQESVETISVLPADPEPREMTDETYTRVLLSLTGQQLYDILYQAQLMTSGSKEEKVKRILDSAWSERSMLNRLRKEDLSVLCRKFGLPVSGSKQELVDRVVDYVPEQLPVSSPPYAQNTDKVPVDETARALVEGEIHADLDPVPLPTNWDIVDAGFSYLSRDEKIVLALVMEAKSITEHDLARIAASHKLSWFLYKANMAELLAKLRANGHPYIQIKSAQNNNVYNWVGSDKTSQILEKKCARDIIDALRHGVVPKDNLHLLMVGQQPARKHLSEILLELHPGKSHFKFIRGQYGSGKTFLCSWLKEFALQNEFAVSFMNISHDQPLSDLPLFFSGVVNGLRTPEKTDSSALVDVLESWLLNIHNKTAQIEGIDAAADKKVLAHAVQKSIEVELANLNDIEPGFAQAIRAFYSGKVENDLELSSNAAAWITGSRALSAQALRDIGVKGYLEPGSVFQRMRAILEIINGARYRGLLLVVDELELIRKFPHARLREQALESLRLLIDEAGRNALPGCLLVFTGTDEFFEDERYGLRSYEALAERVMTPIVHESFVSMRQPIISLESLDQERLTNVIKKVRELYGIAYACEPNQFADDDSISGLIKEWTLFGDENIERKPRPILREFIQMMDLCEENRGVRLAEFLKHTDYGVFEPEPIQSN